MTSPPELLRRARSWLFVPGHRDDRFAKAETSGADCTVLDLEDSVGLDYKAVARENIDRWLSAGGRGVIRINGTDTPWHSDDLAMVDGRSVVMLPKVVSAEQVASVVGRQSDTAPVVVIIETAAGILNAREICSAPGVVRAVFGNADLSSELGIDLADRTALASARFQVVLASAACKLVPPVDGVTAAIADKTALQVDTEHARRLGFTAKLCLHPCQVPCVNEIFSPSAEDIRWAREVLATAGDGSVAMLNSQVVGKPVMDRARRLLARADLSGDDLA